MQHPQGSRAGPHHPPGPRPGRPPHPGIAHDRAAREAELHGARALGLWGGLVGIALLLSLLVPVVAMIVMVIWGDDLAGPPSDDMFHGAEVFFAWLGTSAVGVVLVGLFALAALVLDILMLIRLDRLRTLRAEGVKPLAWSVLIGSGLLTTPPLVVALFVPAQIFGPGAVTYAALVVILLLMVLLPMGGRVAEILSARRLRLP